MAEVEKEPRAAQLGDLVAFVNAAARDGARLFTMAFSNYPILFAIIFCLCI